MNIDHIRWRQRETDAARIKRIRHRVDGIELNKSSLSRCRIVFFCPRRLPHIDDEERCIETAAFHFGQVHLKLCFQTGINFGHGCVGRRDINMCVQCKDRAMHPGKPSGLPCLIHHFKGQPPQANQNGANSNDEKNGS